MAAPSTVPAGVIVAWPDTAASIPAGWTRVNSLNGRYPKGIPDSVTNPGSTGGSATHTHTTPGHTHSVSHTHTQGNTGSGGSNTTSRLNDPGEARLTASPIHSRATTGSSSPTSGSASPTASAASNDPSHKSVIFIQSDGTPTGIPKGAVALWNSTSIPDGWDEEDTDEDDGDLNTSFLKGAAGGKNGSKAKTTISTHAHSVAHTHSGTSHSHTGGQTGVATTASGNVYQNPIGGSTPRFTTPNHTHSVTIGNASTGTLQSSSPTTGTHSMEVAGAPPYRRVKFIENTTADDQPIGVIALWLGALADIPEGWVLCDGTNGTPDLRGRYPRFATGSVGATGGTSNQGHTHSGASHTHTTPSHSHSVTIGSWSHTGYLRSTFGTQLSVLRASSHNHSASNTGSASPGTSSNSTGTTGSTAYEPPYIEVAFIMLASIPDRAAEVSHVEWEVPTPPRSALVSQAYLEAPELVAAPPPGQPLKWLGGRVDVRVEIDTGGEGSNTLVWDIGHWDINTWGSVDPDWFDITRWVQGVEINRGKARWEESFPAGTASIILDNTTGIFNPLSGVATPFLLAFQPGRRIRVVAVPEPLNPWEVETKYPLFTGRIAATFDGFAAGGFDLTVTVPCTDFMADWQNHNPPALETPTGVQRTDERVEAALDRMSWPEALRDVQTGLHTMQSSFLAQPTAQECHYAAQAEGGAFYCSADGKATFKARDWLSDDERSTTIQGYLGYLNVPEVEEFKTAHITNVKLSRELERVKNDIQLARVGGTIYQVFDLDSQGAIGRVQTYRRLDYQNNSDSQIEFLAERFLDAWKDHRYRLEEVTIGGNTDPEDDIDRNRLLWDTQIGDLMACHVRLPEWDFEMQGHVMGITHRISPDDWEVTLRLDDSATFTSEESS